MTLLDSYKRNSRKNGREFSLSLEEFGELTSGDCYYCGSPPSLTKRGGKNNSKSHWGDYVYNGIDRVDNSVGYVANNCVSCCIICNRGKGTMSYQDFMKYIQRIRGLNVIAGKNFINGDFRDADKKFAKINPCNKDHVIGEWPLSSHDEVREAVSVAIKANKDWRKLSHVQRADYIERVCDIIKRDQKKIAESISLDTGKTLNESNAEVIESLHMAQYCVGRSKMPNGYTVSSEIPERQCVVVSKPKGVIAVISPFNFPLAIPGFWSAAPALLEGNCVIIKPSEDAPYSGQMIAEIYKEAGFPAGVIQVIHGGGEVGDLLIKADVNHICFTGSYQVGQHIRIVCAESESKTCSCEMGSKSAVMIFDDASMDIAVPAALNSAFKLSGQRCVSSGRVLVHRSIFVKFRDLFLDVVSKLRVGDPFKHTNVDFGPIINKSQMERVIKFNQLARDDKEVEVLYDPDCKERLNGNGYNGNFLRPFVYQCEWADKPFLKQEVFGPHVALIPFNDVEDAIRIYNDTDYGLSLGVITDNFRTMREVRENCDAGMIYFNLGSIGAESHLPFGGCKKSGYGWSSAAGMFDAVVNKVAVTVNHAPRVSFPQGLK